MQHILGEAHSNYNNEKIEWCQGYMKKMREIVHKKFDAISAHTLEYIENHTKYTPEELEKLKTTASTRKTDSNVRPDFTLNSSNKDISFVIYGCVGAKPAIHKFLDLGGIYSCKVPRQF